MGTTEEPPVVTGDEASPPEAILADVAGDGPTRPVERPPSRAPTSKSDRVFEVLALILFIGPDPPADDDPKGLVSFNMPWSLRLAAVAAALAIGSLWGDTGVGRQLAWGFDYGALVGVSLVASYWRPILAINLGLALLWMTLPLRPPEESRQSRVLWRVHHVVTFLNRQLGHVEAYATGLAVAAVAYPKLSVQLPLAAAVILLGPPLINGIARTRVGEEGAQKAGGRLNWARRPVIYGATLLGLFVLASLAWPQKAKLLPVMLAIALGGLLPRYLRHLRRRHQMRADTPAQLVLRQEYRDLQMGWPRRLDTLVAGALTLAMVGTVVFAWNTRRIYDEDQRAAAGLDVRGRADICAAETGGPTAAEVSLFIVSDTQFHELQANRFPGQAEMADAFVPVALRPVELDLLAPATLWRFRSVYAELAQHAPKGSVMWAHLGDFADLSCAGEMTRATALLARFGDIGPLAGVAPGNHDKSFTGNFFWSPFWDSACAQRLEKTDSDAEIRALAAGRLVTGGRMQPVTGGFWKRLGQLGGITGRGGALATVSPLGEVTHLGKRRGLIAVFMDTADEIDFDFGIAGIYGTFSGAQRDAIVGMVHDLQAARRREHGGASVYDDPVYLLFGHHPFDETTSGAHGNIADLIARLDGAADPTTSVLGGEDSAAEERARDQPPRVLALISAHTHSAQSSFHCVRGRRFLRELVVGSTIDPPQEAALLTVGPDADGQVAVRLRTLPAVGREEKTCGDDAFVPAAACRALVGELQAAPDCGPLFKTDDALLGSDCQHLERPQTLRQRLEAISRSRGPTTPRRIKAAQVVRTRHLLSCVCRGGRCQPPETALTLTDDKKATDFLLGLLQTGTAAERTAWERELTCLSWAASAVQKHKAAGMEMTDALRCAFDDGTITAAKDYVAALKPRECR